MCTIQSIVILHIEFYRTLYLQDICINHARQINLNSSIITGIMLLLTAILGLSVICGYGITKDAFGEPLSFEGHVWSIQNNDSGLQTWLTYGKWKLNEIPANTSSVAGKNESFSANLTMIKIDGTYSHKHMLTDLKVTDLRLNNETTILSGTVTLITDAMDKIPGLVNQTIFGIPVKIQMINNRTITIDMDGNKTNNHFGNLPIYGNIS